MFYDSIEKHFLFLENLNSASTNQDSHAIFSKSSIQALVMSNLLRTEDSVQSVPRPCKLAEFLIPPGLSNLSHEQLIFFKVNFENLKKLYRADYSPLNMQMLFKINIYWLH